VSRRVYLLGVAVMLVGVAFRVTDRLVCPPGVTEANVGRVRPGMTLRQAAARLGRPGEFGVSRMYDPMLVTAEGNLVPRLLYFSGVALLAVALAFLASDRLIYPPGVTRENVARNTPGMPFEQARALLGVEARRASLEMFASWLAEEWRWDGPDGEAIVCVDTETRLVTLTTFQPRRRGRAIPGRTGHDSRRPAAPARPRNPARGFRSPPGSRGCERGRRALARSVPRGTPARDFSLAVEELPAIAWF
jgi:hypothetical protein